MVATTRGEHDEAVSFARESVEIFSRIDARPDQEAFARFRLASALANQGKSVEQALEQAHLARTKFVEAGEDERVAEVDAWLDENASDD